MTHLTTFLGGVDVFKAVLVERYIQDRVAKQFTDGGFTHALVELTDLSTCHNIALFNVRLVNAASYQNEQYAEQGLYCIYLSHQNHSGGMDDGNRIITD